MDDKPSGLGSSPGKVLQAPALGAKPEKPKVDREFARPENEDDDGYAPWSDRRPNPEPLFERDPWS